MEEETIEDVKAAYALLYRDMAALRAKADGLLAFANEYVSAWSDGMAGDSYLLRLANAAIANYTGA